MQPLLVRTRPLPFTHLAMLITKKTESPVLYPFLPSSLPSSLPHFYSFESSATLPYPILPYPILRRYGFSLFIGVALDTFIVRTVLVPAVITVVGGHSEAGLNWWPSVMPPLAYATPEEEHEALMAGLWVPAPAPSPNGDAKSKNIIDRFSSGSGSGSGSGSSPVADMELALVSDQAAEAAEAAVAAVDKA